MSEKYTIRHSFFGDDYLEDENGSKIELNKTLLGDSYYEIDVKKDKAEDKISTNSAKKFIKKILDLPLGHESVIEHYTITVRVICDRGVSHEIVRHRIASYTQESTRYCNYSMGNLVERLL